MKGILVLAALLVAAPAAADFKDFQTSNPCDKLQPSQNCIHAQAGAGASAAVRVNNMNLKGFTFTVWGTVIGMPQACKEDGTTCKDLRQTNMDAAAGDWAYGPAMEDTFVKVRFNGVSGTGDVYLTGK
jgi:hypothetical protein